MEIRPRMNYHPLTTSSDSDPGLMNESYLVEFEPLLSKCELGKNTFNLYLPANQQK